MMKKITDMIEYPKEGILSKEVYKDEKVEVTLFCMAKNTEIGEHTSTKKGIVHVIEGSGEFKLGEEKIEIEQGKIIIMNENAVHSLKSKDKTSFLLYLY